MLAMPPKDRVSSTAVQHSDGVSNTHIRRVDHHAEIPREYYVELTTLERTSTAPLFMPVPHPCAAPPNTEPPQAIHGESQSVRSRPSAVGSTHPRFSVHDTTRGRS
jgi:hypothetical protein